MPVPCCHGFKSLVPVFSRVLSVVIQVIEAGNHPGYRSCCWWPKTNYVKCTIIEPQCKKTSLRGFQPDPIQIGLYSHKKSRNSYCTADLFFFSRICLNTIFS